MDRYIGLGLKQAKGQGSAEGVRAIGRRGTTRMQLSRPASPARESCLSMGVGPRFLKAEGCEKVRARPLHHGHRARLPVPDARELEAGAGRSP